MYRLQDFFLKSKGRCTKGMNLHVTKVLIPSTPLSSSVLSSHPIQRNSLSQVKSSVFYQHAPKQHSLASSSSSFCSCPHQPVYVAGSKFISRTTSKLFHFSPATHNIISLPFARGYMSSASSNISSYDYGDRDQYKMHATTILCVRKGNQVVMMGDGQVSQGPTVVKSNARKVRRLGVGSPKSPASANKTKPANEKKSQIIAGFAGSTADCFTLMERLERKLEEHPGQLTRACVDLAKAWRTDKYLRRLEASLLVADEKNTYEITGLGDVLEPKDGVISIGSGGTYALAAARALMDQDHLNAEEIAKKAMTIAADICVYTNHNFVTEKIEVDETKSEEESPSSNGNE